MSNTTIYNNAGKTLIVDKIIERKSSTKQTTTQKEQYYSKAALLSNYNKLQEKLLTWVDDDFLSSNEKAQLRKEFLSIDSTYSSIKIQAENLNFNNISSKYKQDYDNFINSYNNLKSFISPYLEKTESESIDSSLLESLLSSYYSDISTIEEKIFEVLYGSTTQPDIELTSEFFVFQDEQTPAYPQTIQAYLKTSDLIENYKFYINDYEVEIPENRIVDINIENILSREVISLKLTSEKKETTKIIRKIYNGSDSIQVQITSTNGNIFRNGTANTVLYAQVFKGDQDITESLDSSKFRWIRKSSGSELEDEQWNSSSKAIGKKQINITPKDSIGRTIFSCEVDI